VTTDVDWIPRHVIHERVQALQAWLLEHDYGAYLVSNVENTAYLTGWRLDVEPWERPILTIVPRQGLPSMVLHELSIHGTRMARERGTMIVDDVTFYIEQPSPQPGPWSRDRWGALAAERLAARGLPTDARLACDALPPVLPELTERVLGAPIAGIDRAALEVIDAYGFAENVHHRAGHGIGLRGHDLPDDMAFNTRPLRAGEVYTIEPGIYLYGLGGFRIDDTIVVADPPESLTHTPRDIDDVILSG
jgi:Xaa-Pro aminopeptidase